MNTSGSSLNSANRKERTKILVFLGSKNKKHLRGSTQATIHPLAIILTAALWVLVSIIALPGSIVALILPPLCFLYYHFLKQKHGLIFAWDRQSNINLHLPIILLW